MAAEHPSRPRRRLLAMAVLAAVATSACRPRPPAGSGTATAPAGTSGDAAPATGTVAATGPSSPGCDGQQLVALGSHGYDSGNPQKRTFDVGVEYQKIRSTKDWLRWDRRTMDLAACWRHEAFAVEADRPAGSALRQACDPGRCGAL